MSRATPSGRIARLGARQAPRWSARVLGVVAVVPLALMVAAGTTSLRVGAPLALSATPPALSAASPATVTALPGTSGTVRRPPASHPQPAPAPDRITMAFSGDILIHQGLWERAAAQATGGARFDFRPELAPVRPVVGAADLAICHLETPLSPDDRGLSSYPVFETPHEVAGAIASAGYDGCSTASNHTLDGGSTGVKATLHWLDHAGLRHAGSARTPRESRRVTTYTVDGAVAVAHLAYAFGFNGFVPDHQWRANRILVPKILQDAGRARKSGADLVVVSLHWGVEYTHSPTAWQREVADRLTRSPNVDLIVGHHAHVVQPITRLRGTWVTYGMGNLLSGMTSSLGTPAVEDGMILVATAERRVDEWRVTKLSFVPTWVEYGTWRVLPIARTLAMKWPSATLRATLRASWARTVAAVDLLGAERLGVRPVGHLPS